MKIKKIGNKMVVYDRYRYQVLGQEIPLEIEEILYLNISGSNMVIMDSNKDVYVYDVAKK